MPAESLIPPPALEALSVLAPNAIKCSNCGGSGLPSSSSRGGEEVIILDETIERICAGCWRAQQSLRDEFETSLEGVLDEQESALGGIGLGLRGMQLDNGDRSRNAFGREGEDDRSVGSVRSVTPPTPPAIYAQPSPPSLLVASPLTPVTHSQGALAQSLPPPPTRPWLTRNATAIPPIREEPRREDAAAPCPSSFSAEARPPNPLLDVTRERVSSQGRGALYPGSVFKGSQTSGRSAYDVEVRFIDVNFPESTVSGYLSISHLTDTHPHLTTFFTGEIIGPKYGFITGARFGATEHDDMRHWGRFEQFRRPSTRADMLRPELLLREPIPDRRRAAIGETRGRERDFVFLRIKERFLVPDHTVRDISGASFAGFYFAMIDLAPSGNTTDMPPTPTSPSAPKSPGLPSSSSPQAQYFPLVSPSVHRRQSTGPPAVVPPPAPRRMSSSGTGAGGGGGGVPRSPSAEIGTVPARRRRESSGTVPKVDREGPREATIRGYYFHSLNQEPFQELFLTHVPNRSTGAFEMR